MVQRYIIVRFQRALRAFNDYILHALLHTEDPPHKLALGVALGVFWAFTPTIGLQMLLVVVSAWILRANKAAGLPVVWISNAFTAIPMYWACWYVGYRVLRTEYIDGDWWLALSTPPEGWWPAVKFFYLRFAEIAWPLTIGCLIVATILGYITYLATYYAIKSYRMRRWGQLTPPAPHKRPTESQVATVKPDVTE